MKGHSIEIESVIMIRHAVAGTLLAFALGVAGAAQAQVRPAEKCYDCPAPRVYDTQETIRTTRDIDRSQVIETQSEIPAGTRVNETNHLIVRENETRNVGVIRHKHTIIEKDVRYVRRVPVVTTVSFVVHKYRVVETPATIAVPVPDPRPIYRCSRGKRMDRYGHCVLRVRG